MVSLVLPRTMVIAESGSDKPADNFAFFRGGFHDLGLQNKILLYGLSGSRRRQPVDDTAPPAACKDSIGTSLQLDDADSKRLPELAELLRRGALQITLHPGSHLVQAAVQSGASVPLERVAESLDTADFELVVDKHVKKLFAQVKPVELTTKKLKKQKLQHTLQIVGQGYRITARWDRGQPKIEARKDDRPFNLADLPMAVAEELHGGSTQHWVRQLLDEATEKEIGFTSADLGDVRFFYCGPPCRSPSSPLSSISPSNPACPLEYTLVDVPDAMLPILEGQATRRALGSSMYRTIFGVTGASVFVRYVSHTVGFDTAQLRQPPRANYAALLMQTGRFNHSLQLTRKGGVVVLFHEDRDILKVAEKIVLKTLSIDALPVETDLSLKHICSLEAKDSGGHLATALKATKILESASVVMAGTTSAAGFVSTVGSFSLPPSVRVVNLAMAKVVDAGVLAWFARQPALLAVARIAALDEVCLPQQLLDEELKADELVKIVWLPLVRLTHDDWRKALRDAMTAKGIVGV